MESRKRTVQAIAEVTVGLIRDGKETDINTALQRATKTVTKEMRWFRSQPELVGCLNRVRNMLAK